MSNPNRQIDALIEKHVFHREPCEGWELQVEHVKWEIPGGAMTSMDHTPFAGYTVRANTLPVPVPALTRTCDHSDNVCYPAKEYDTPVGHLGGPRNFTESADMDLCVLVQARKWPNPESVKFINHLYQITDSRRGLVGPRRQISVFLFSYRPGDYGRAALKALGVQFEEEE